MMQRLRALSVTAGAMVLLGYSTVGAGKALAEWNQELSLLAGFFLIAGVLLALCGGVWFACAAWLRMRVASRIASALALPLVWFWALLQFDGAMFKDVVFVMFLFPLVLLEGGLILLLERKRSLAKM